MNLAFTKKFLKQVTRINDKKLASDLENVINAVEEASVISEIKNIKKLKGHENYFRIRIGDYRIGIYYHNNNFEFAAIDHRKDIYKYFP